MDPTLRSADTQHHTDERRSHAPGGGVRRWQAGGFCRRAKPLASTVAGPTAGGRAGAGRLSGGCGTRGGLPRLRRVGPTSPVVHCRTPRRGVGPCMRRRPATHLLQGVIRAYRAARPGRYPTCRFSPTCSAYALEALEVHGAARGSWLAARRLMRCNPWGRIGVDPVPPGRHAPAGPVSSPIHTPRTES